MYLVFTCMSGESYRMRLWSLCDIFWVLINSLVCWFCVPASSVWGGSVADPGAGDAGGGERSPGVPRWRHVWPDQAARHRHRHGRQWGVFHHLLWGELSRVYNTLPSNWGSWNGVVIWFLSKMMLLFTLRKQVLTQEKIWDEEEEGKNDESNDTNNKHTKKELHLKHSQQSGDIVSTKWTWILSCRTAAVAVYVNSDPNLCILRPNYCLNKVNANLKLQNSHCCSVCKLRPKSVYTQTQLLSVNANPKLQNSHCCSVCKLRPKSVYTQTQLCINSDPNLCILRPNSVSTQTQICVYSDPTLYQLRPKSVYTWTQLCINSDPNLCILGPNSVSTQTKICTKSELRSCVKAEVDVLGSLSV